MINFVKEHFKPNKKQAVALTVAGLGLGYSVLERVMGESEGWWSEALIPIALVIALLLGGPKPKAHGPAPKED